MLALDNGQLSIHKLVLGIVKTNCYIIKTPQICFLIDPVGEPETIISYLNQSNLKPEFLLATHGHFDHIGAAAALIQAGFGECLYVHPLDIEECQKAGTYSLLLKKEKLNLPSSIKTYDSEIESRLNKNGFHLRHLPGHTKGSMCIYTTDKKILFCGDTILNNLLAMNPSPARETPDDLRQSLLTIQKEFSPTTVLFSGHGDLTWLQTEYAYNKRVKSLIGGTKHESTN